MTFTPNFITKVVTTLAILPIFAAPVPANAGEVTCNGFKNIEYCIKEVATDTFQIDVTNIHDLHTTTVVAECEKTGTRFGIPATVHPEDGQDIAKAFCDHHTGLDNEAVQDN